MLIEELTLANFRNIAQLRLPLSPSLNFIIGDNGAGKSSILEAISLLSSGKGFRSGSNQQYISQGQPSCTVFASLRDDSSISHKLGIQKSRNGELTVRYNAKSLTRRSDLAGLLPLTLITPDSHRIISESASERRNYLDWTLFHVKQSFISTWRQYNHALKQRNALLKRGKGSLLDELSSWDSQLADSGEQLVSHRLDILSALVAEITYFTNLFLPEFDFSFSLHKGWRDTSLLDALVRTHSRDKTIGYTTQGPQRGDLVIRTTQGLAREVLSRGQQKLLVIAMMLARLKWLAQHRGKVGLLLIDDLAAELDKTRQAVLLKEISEIGAQTIITSIDPSLMAESRMEGMKMFHVKHGELVDVI